MEDLLQVAKNHGGTEYERVRNRCLMEILYASGMRISELMSLPVSSVRGSPEMILVKGKGSKERLVPLSPSAIEALFDWLKLRDQKEDLRLNKMGKKRSKFLFPSSSKHCLLLEGKRNLDLFLPILFLSLIHISEPTRPY